MKVSTITRGKVTAAAIGPRTMLGASALDQEQFQNIELLLPPGYVAAPAAGADVLILECNGQRDHKVALGGDNTADTIADLPAGARGIALAGGGSVIISSGGITIATTMDVTIAQAATVMISAADIVLTGTVDIVGDVHVTGNITVNGVSLAVP